MLFKYLKTRNNIRNPYEFLEILNDFLDEGQKNMKEYMELRALTEEAETSFGESVHYQQVKDWFLDKYYI